MTAAILDLAEQRRRRGLPAATAPAPAIADSVDVDEIDGLVVGGRAELPDGSRGTVLRLELCVDGTVRAYLSLGWRHRMEAAHRLRPLPSRQQANGVRPEV